MSTTQREIMIPRTVKAVRCDGPDCTNEVSEHPDGLGRVAYTPQWLIVDHPVSHSQFDFCSPRCLVAWANQHTTQVVESEPDA